MKWLWTKNCVLQKIRFFTFAVKIYCDETYIRRVVARPVELSEGLDRRCPATILVQGPVNIAWQVPLRLRAIYWAPVDFHAMISTQTLATWSNSCFRN